MPLPNGTRLAEDAEVTLEANRDDLRPEDRLEAWKASGINRLSIGVQSFREEDLRWMNRAHSADQAREAIQAARAAGFAHDSIDLIYGTPGLTDEAWLGKGISAPPSIWAAPTSPVMP